MYSVMVYILVKFQVHVVLKGRVINLKQRFAVRIYRQNKLKN